MARPKIALIGAGQIGGTLAHLVGLKELGDVVLFDIVEGIPAGQGARSSPSPRRSTASTPSSPAPIAYAGIEGADVCIVTAGVPRKPGMSRDDLLEHQSQGDGAGRRRHQEICARTPSSSASPIRSTPWSGRCRNSPACPSNMVVGMAGVLDSRALPLFPRRGVQRLGRGRHRLRARRPRRHHGAADPLFDGRRHSAARSRQDGLDHARSGSTRSSSAPATAAPRSSTCSRPARPSTRRRPRPSPWPRAISRTRSACCPAPPTLNGEYGVKDLYVGVPVVIGAKGVERIVEIELNGAERAMFDKSVAAVQALIEACKKIAPHLGEVISAMSRCGEGRASELHCERDVQRSMNIHEYQAKAVLREFGVPVPRGIAAFSRRGGGQGGAASSAARSWWSRRRSMPAAAARRGGVKVGRSRLEDVRRGGQAHARHRRSSPIRPARTASRSTASISRTARRSTASSISPRWSTAPPRASPSSPRPKAAWTSRRSRTTTPEKIVTFSIDPADRLSAAIIGRRGRRRRSASPAISPSRPRALVEQALRGLHRQGHEPARDQSAGRHQGRQARLPRRQDQLRRQRALPPPGHVRRCATSTRRTRRRSRPRSTTSPTSRSTAPSAAWSTAPASPWRPWTSSSSTATSRPTSSTSAAAPPRRRSPRRSRSSPPTRT